MVWYFAFGSNMCANRLAERIGRMWKTRQLGLLRDHALCFNKKARGSGGVGYANVVPQPETDVPGILYDVSEDALATLDAYEGVPSHYVRQQVHISVSDAATQAADATTAATVPAVAYVAVPDATALGLRPTAEYLQFLLNGADLLPPEHVAWLQHIELAPRPED